MRKFLTPGNIFYGILIVLLLIPTTRVLIQSRILRLVLTSPGIEESGENLNSRKILLYNMNDQQEHLEIGNGKPVLINLWATWCGPCVAEMPSLNKLHEKYKGKVDFALISSEENDVLKNFIKKNEYTFPIYHLGQALPVALESNQLPTTYIIGSDGKILMSETGAKNWNSSAVHEVLNKELGYTNK